MTAKEETQHLRGERCICDPFDLAALGHMTNCPERDPDEVRLRTAAERLRRQGRNDPLIDADIRTVLLALDSVVKVLEPFATVSELPEHWGDESNLAAADYRKLKVKHFRAAAALLSRLKGTAP